MYRSRSSSDHERDSQSVQHFGVFVLRNVHSLVECNRGCHLRFKDTARTQIALSGLGHVTRADDPNQPPASTTVVYSAPEILRGGKIGPPVDMYALGVCMYVLISGEVPAKDVFETTKLQSQPASRRGSKQSLCQQPHGNTLKPPSVQAASVDLDRDEQCRLIVRLELSRTA